MWDTILSGSPWRGEIVNRRRDGTHYHEEQTITPVFDTAGQVAFFIGIKQDISHRKEVEQALRDSEALNRAVLQSLPAHIALLDNAGRIVSVNYAWERFAAEDGGENPFRAAEGVNYLDACSVPTAPPAAREAAEGIRAVLRGTLPRFSLEYRTGSPGRPRWFFLQVVPLEGGRQGAVVSHEDISGMKRAEDHLNHVQKLESLGRLAGVVAHDFNNLLSIINGYSDLLLMNMAATEPARADIARIRTAGENGARLTQQLLTFSRKQPVQLTSLDVSRAVAEMEEMLRRLVGEEIELVTSFASSSWSVKADAGQVHQLVMNLVTNARDAMRGGGRLEIGTGNIVVSDAESAASGVPKGSYVRLSISDTGSGMDEQTQSHIFEPFFTTKPPGSGTGLGLSTVYGILRQCGGHITVASAPGRGSTFQIYFPRTAAEAPAGKLTQPAAPGRSGTILVVEDGEEVRRLSSEILRRHGFTVLEAGNGPRALELAAAFAGPIDLVVTDVVMPLMRAGEMVVQLKRSRPGLKVLYMSGYSATAAGAPFEEGPGVAFLPKPFTPDQLTGAVGKLLDGGARPLGTAARAG